MREVLDAFTGEATHSRRSRGYRIWIVTIAFLVLLLPVLYIGFIGLVIQLLIWHVTSASFTIGQIGGPFFLLVGYFGPLVAGIILVLFLLKPLFARAPRARRGRRLSLGREPVLFAFVTRVARAVSAPEPAHIEVNCLVNASASFGQGLFGLFGRHMTLTIGLPLAGGLNAQQFAGILAHELGHFSQGAGMRLSYLIRAINGWFARAVYEGDSWDDTLRDWVLHARWFAIVFIMAQIAIAVSRGLLWVLMMISHALTCALERQMEYDADRFMAAIAGSRAFAATFRQTVVLDIAGQLAMTIFKQSWKTGRHIDDLPQTIVELGADMPEKGRRKLQRLIGKQKTGLFDTHPAYSDRLNRVKRQNDAGVFHLDRSASELLGDFGKLCRATTKDLYRRSISEVDS
jgi:Zn-dependent protease with chaperone function